MSLDFLKGKTILVTGGTGSFGQKFVRTVLNSQARKVIVFSRDELKQSQMLSNIPDPENKLRFFIGDIRDLERLEMAFKGVDYVVHAAALKQVPALEYNPFEAIKTNIIGTQNVINSALHQKVKKVLLVSTDKAANPATLYGATKLCAERLIISSNVYGGDDGTIFGAVRYGNVLGSRGSIAEVIAKQKPSGEITLTHEEMTRFWITLDQGVNLVLMALENMCGGEIFIPKIPSMRLKDLISALAPECKIKIVGIRPGEKIHEVLVTSEEARHAREFSDYYVILPEYHWWNGHQNFIDGKVLSDGFHFSSHTNDKWFTSEEIKRLIDLV